MSKTASLRDIKKASWLKEYNEIELLSIENDEKVGRVLEALGFDLEYPTYYFAANHRDLSGTVKVGFMVCGEVSCNRKHLTSCFADITDVLIASAYSDTSLTKELANLSGLSRAYEPADDYAMTESELLFPIPPDQLEKDWENMEKQIITLNELRDFIRGPMYNESGGMKTSKEYKEWALGMKQLEKGGK